MSPRTVKARGAARLAAVQALYQMEVGGEPLDRVVSEFEEHRLGAEVEGVRYRDADIGYFRSLVAGVVSSQRELDPEIHAALVKGWPLSRLDVTLRAILRSALLELTAHPEVPARVVIDEYLEVAKAFFAGDEPGMVNGVLDTLARRLRPDEFTRGVAGSS